MGATSAQGVVNGLLGVELDQRVDAFERKDRAARWRAGYTLAVFDRIFERSTGPSRLRAADFSALASNGIPRGEITIEIVFDPPGHVRLPINDDEIVDRALAIEPLAARQVRLVTYDTGQSTRAGAAGLQAVKLTKPLEEEPNRANPPNRLANDG